ncbi:MAG: hypothetical protein WBF93_16175, partial [Pirellulales bacterium]
HKEEDRKKKTERRRQKEEDRKKKTERRRQKEEDRKKKTERRRPLSHRVDVPPSGQGPRNSL